MSNEHGLQIVSTENHSVTLNKNESSCNLVTPLNNSNSFLSTTLLIASPKFHQIQEQQEIATQNRSIQVDVTTTEISNSVLSITLDEILSRFEAQDKLFRCNYCDIIFVERGMYFLHIALHGNNPWQCSICHKIMQDKNEFTLHFVNQKHST